MTDDSSRLSGSDGTSEAAETSTASDSETSASAATSDNATTQRRGPPPNPLYHPLFLPVLLVAFSLWFFYDGFLTTDPEMQKHQLFNRVAFGVTALFCLRVVPRGIREFKEDRAAAAKEN